tara:strand:+ start:251 stop:418 length:168 start_codon:yes stop_codon:yes gene_type:complete
MYWMVHLDYPISLIVPQTGLEPVTLALEGRCSNPTELLGHLNFVVKGELKLKRIN